MLEAISVYILVGLVASAFTIAGDIRTGRFPAEEIDIVALFGLYILRALTWPYGLYYYVKRR